MRCSPARKAYLFDDRASGHLERCVRCRAWIRDQDGIDLALAALRGDVPWDVDIGARVAARIAALERPGRDRRAGRQLAWAAGAGLAAAAAIAMLAWLRLPDPALILAEARALAVALGETARALASPLPPLVAAAARLLPRMLEAAAALLGAAAGLRGAATAAIAACAATMAAIVLLVVGRDVRRHHLLREEERR
jgi:hypothetical protein